LLGLSGKSAIPGLRAFLERDLAELVAGSALPTTSVSGQVSESLGVGAHRA